MKTWLGILTAVVAVETLAIGIYCCSELKVDSNSPSVLISALGVLVTFVVAWQIWQTMASREEIKEAREAVKRIDAIEKKVDNIVPTTDAHFQFSLAMAMRVKGLELAEMWSEDTKEEDRHILAQKTLYTSMAFSQFLSALKMYSDIETIAKEYIDLCFHNIQNMATCMRGNYGLITTGLIQTMISDLSSALAHSGRALTQTQISELEELRKELEQNLSNGIDADAALRKRQQQRDAKNGNQKDVTEGPSPAAGAARDAEPKSDGKES